LFTAGQCRLRVDGESVAHDHAEALDGPGQFELTLLHFVEAFEDLVPEICRGHGPGANEAGIGSRLLRLAILHRHARPLHSAPATGCRADRWSMDAIVHRDRLRSVAGRVLHRTVGANY